MTSATLLTPAEAWNAKIYSNGWKKAGLGTVEVIDKATGAKLGETGVASAADISAAAAAARTAQKSWAKFAGPARGDVLRGVSRLLLAHSKEIADQLVRETGSTGQSAVGSPDQRARISGGRSTRQPAGRRSDGEPGCGASEYRPTDSAWIRGRRCGLNSLTPGGGSR
jgi:hypothetical protein